MNGDYGATAAVRTLRDGLLQGFLSTANYENLGCAVCVERVGHHTAEACSIAVSWYFVTGFVNFCSLVLAQCGLFFNSCGDTVDLSLPYWLWKKKIREQTIVLLVLTTSPSC